ncbi:MAG: SusC/RagA family TonB-linked outer membrane protein [Culturomica sp.]|jgi:TonB-linked SusC/RagA family outer membrane protein|nr:SusC/RagA family TonB-linked outer membrane protein [Culturomica sp.]
MKFEYLLKRIFTIAFLALPGMLWAQQSMLRGVVTHVTDGPIPGVTVYVQNENKRTLVGVATNLNGEYFLSIPKEENLTIIYSFVGMKTKTIPYKGQAVENVVLEDMESMLEAVQVTARRRDVNAAGIVMSDLGAARERVNTEEMQTMQVTSIEDALQGRLGGVDIIASSGDPGARMGIRIRGISSLSTSNEPMVVVDHVPYDVTFGGEFDFQTATDEDFGALLNIAPSDIEDIEVLKDATATALYGTRAINGVLLITTKRGTTGKPRFSFVQKIDWKKEPKGIPLLNGKEYVSMIQDGMWNRMYSSEQGFHWTLMENMIKYPEINFDPAFNYYDEYNQDTDWLGLITRTGLTSNTNFSMSGGGDRAMYRFSIDYQSEEGTTKGSGLKRLTTRLNVDYSFSEKLRVTAGFSYTDTQKEDNWFDSGKIRSHARKKMPNMSPYIIGADGKPTSEYFTPIEASHFQGAWKADGTGVFNPLAMVNESFKNQAIKTSGVKFGLTYTLTEDLIYRGVFGIDLATQKTKGFLPQAATGLLWTHEDFNTSLDNTNDKRSIEMSNLISYSRSEINPWLYRLTLSLKQDVYDHMESAYSGEVSKAASAENSDPSAGGSLRKIGSGSSRARGLGVLFMGSVNLWDRYVISPSLRYEGSTKMGNSNRWMIQPVVDLNWKIHNEGFMGSVDWVDELMLRYNWGISGTSPNENYAYAGTFAPEGTYITRPNNGGSMSGIGPSEIQLDNLKWQTKRSHNLGFTLNMKSYRYGITFDVYDNKINDMLHKDVGIPTSTGFSKVNWYNTGSMNSRGWELVLNINRLPVAQDLTLSANFNFSRNRNKILSLPSNKNFVDYPTSPANDRYASSVELNQPLGAFYGFRYLGVYDNEAQTVTKDRNGNPVYDLAGRPVYTTVRGIQMRPGDAWYDDVNHDGVIDNYDIVYLGNAMPVVTAGATFTLAYKDKLSLRAGFQSRYGQKVINQTRINTENMYGTNNQSKAVLKRWRNTGDRTDIPRALNGYGYNYLGSSRFVEDASFLRLKTLSLTYTWKGAKLAALGLQRIQAYVTGYDLFTWTKYTGQDPEIMPREGLHEFTKDESYTPRQRRIALGVTIDF